MITVSLIVVGIFLALNLFFTFKYHKVIVNAIEPIDYVVFPLAMIFFGSLLVLSAYIKKRRMLKSK
ncbi:MAG: hypothetical protein WAU02_02115 [Candidatus Saccharimonadales bacterium]